VLQFRAVLLLHLSDLHLSRYGETGTWTEREEEEREWEPVHVWKRWQIEGRRDRKGRPDDLRLVDPEGVVHKVRGWPNRKDDRVISALLAIAMERHQTSAERLIHNRPTAEDLAAMLQIDPYNTNLRFIKLVDQVLAVGPEVLLITGDLTDNGFGYGLVLHYFRPWIDAQRLFAVPGNHDIYDMLPRRGRRARTEARLEHYQEFAAKIGLETGRAGAYVRRLGDVAVVGLNSCRMPRTPLSASGAVAREQLSWLEELAHDDAFRSARLRIGLVHHHLLRMPFAVGKRSPIEVGMRLRNATEVMQTCVRARLNILFNGHRHHGYLVQLPGRPMVISSPSSTLGCKSIDRVYAWRLDLDDRYPFPVIHDLIEQPRGNTDGRDGLP
jgi:Icc protein